MSGVCCLRQSIQPPVVTVTVFVVLYIRPGRGVLDRSPEGVRWMEETLARALTTVNERQNGDDSGRTSPEPKPPAAAGERDGGGGLRGVCRTLFHHCAVTIGYVGPTESAEGGGPAVSRGAGGVRKWGLFLRRHSCASV